MTRVASRALALLPLLLAPAHAGPAHAAPTSVASPAGPEGGRGPRARSVPAGAVVAEDEEQLRRLVAEGPKDIWLAPKTYRTALTIRRPVALHGQPGTVVEGPGHGSVIVVDADDVLLEDLEVRGSGQNHVTEDAGVHAAGARVVVRHVKIDGTLFGVAFEQCHGCLLEGSVVYGADLPLARRGDGIKLWEAHDSIVRDNRVEHARDVVVWYSRNTRCEHNEVEGGRYGTHFMYAHDGIVRDSKLRGNVVGVFVMYSARLLVEDNVLAGARGAAGMGLGFKDSDGVAARRNALIANTVGLFVDRSPTTPERPVSIADNDLRLNLVAVSLHGDSEGVSFTRNDFVSNASLLEVSGGGDALRLTFEGNHYAEYQGYDLDGDGVGDVPFSYVRLSSELTAEHPELEFLQGTVAMTLIDAIARTFPLLRPRTLLRDPHPAMRPHPRAS